jgi:hypothetical protein
MSCAELSDLICDLQVGDLRTRNSRSLAIQRGSRTAETSGYRN